MDGIGFSIYGDMSSISLKTKLFKNYRVAFKDFQDTNCELSKDYKETDRTPIVYLFKDYQDINRKHC